MSANKFEGLNRKQRRAQTRGDFVPEAVTKTVTQSQPDLEAAEIYLPSIDCPSGRWIPPSVMMVMTPHNNIPEQYHNPRHLDTNSGIAKTPAEYQHLLSKWFYGGLNVLTPELKPGVHLYPGESFIKHVGTILQSFDPRHEHKFAYLTYLLDKCCTQVTWESLK